MTDGLEASDGEGKDSRVWVGGQATATIYRSLAGYMRAPRQDVALERGDGTGKAVKRDCGSAGELVFSRCGNSIRSGLQRKGYVMAIPGYQEFMLPILKLAADGGEHTVPQAMEALAKELQLSAEDQELLLPSGTQTRFYNRVSWAVTYLAKSLLLEKAGRGKFRISQRGREVLAGGPTRIDNAFLEQFEEYKNFKSTRRVDSLPDASSASSDSSVQLTPAEQLNEAYEEIRDTLADDLLERVRGATPKDFERLVVQLLVALGYGGGQTEHAEVTGKSGDDGIDGVIREDRLGLDMVYVQAKKWEYTVGPGEIDKFVGSLMRKKATKGVFITSGKFTDGAERAAREAAVKVRLIDGIELAKLMFDFDVGVSPVRTYTLKRIDTDFFEELSLG